VGVLRVAGWGGGGGGGGGGPTVTKRRNSCDQSLLLPAADPLQALGAPLAAAPRWCGKARPGVRCSWSGRLLLRALHPPSPPLPAAPTRCCAEREAPHTVPEIDCTGAACCMRVARQRGSAGSDRSDEVSEAKLCVFIN